MPSLNSIPGSKIPNNRFLACLLKRGAGLALAFLISLAWLFGRTQAASPKAEGIGVGPAYSVSLPLVVRGTAQNSSMVADWLVYLNTYRALAGCPQSVKTRSG